MTREEYYNTIFVTLLCMIAVVIFGPFIYLFGKAVLFPDDIKKQVQEVQAEKEAQEQLENERKTYDVYLDGKKVEGLSASQYHDVEYDDVNHICYIKTTVWDKF